MFKNYKVFKMLFELSYCIAIVYCLFWIIIFFGMFVFDNNSVVTIEPVLSAAIIATIIFFDFKEYKGAQNEE